MKNQVKRIDSKSQNPVPLDQPLPGRTPHAALSRPLGFAAMPKDFEWVKKNIPCQAACPAGTDIPGYLQAISTGDFDRAYRINLEDNIFPAVLGRVCTRPCEPACRHGWKGLGEPVAICFSKRSSESFAKEKGPVVLPPVFSSSGKKVAVVGAGPAGLAAARELARWGHEVTVFEKQDRPGGLMIQGIPAFRLPREVVEREIRQIELCGVKIQCGVAVGGDLSLDDLRSRHDAVVLAAGCYSPVLPEIPNVGISGVRHGLEFLREVNETGKAAVGRRVVVIGGGFTAVDCARMALRLGAGDVKVFYRRSESEMYITGHEVQAMNGEGAVLATMTAPLAVLGTEHVTGIRLARTAWSGQGADGRRQVSVQLDTAFEVPADLVILATGQRVEDRWRQVSEGAGLFVTGDCATGALSIIDAIGHAKACARKVDEFLSGRKRWQELVHIENATRTGRTRDMDALPRNSMNELDPSARGLLDEVETGYVREQAMQEARRCYVCSYKFEIDNDLCIYCDRCLKVKPVEGCIVKASDLVVAADGRIDGVVPSAGPRDYNLLYIDQNLCIRCGACAEVCPVECISLQQVKPVWTKI